MERRASSDREKVLRQIAVSSKASATAALFVGSDRKAMSEAAAALAAELGLKLVRVDLRSLVSKYAGETEKNLDRVFESAASSGAVLFFDEADALFGKRTSVKDSHDRFANIEVGDLVRRIENYPGLMILATNLRTNVDEAFLRRMRYQIEFPLTK